MKVYVEDALFRLSDLTLKISALLDLGLEGPHYFQLEPTEAPCYEQWLSRQTDPYVREVAQWVLREAGTKGEAAHPSALAIRVTAGEADWQAPIPRLPLSQALPFLHQPLVLLVEDEPNDGAFLQTVMTGPRSDYLRKALDRGWAKFRHGAGVEGIQRLLAATPDLVEQRLRTWVLCDSDVIDPAAPMTNGSSKLKAWCDQHGMPCHRLRRRASENYLPLPALDLWFAGQHRQPIVRLLGAFRQLSTPQRHHFNMKAGLGLRGDARRESCALYEGLSQSTMEHLQDGFGKDVAELFRSHVENSRQGMVQAPRRGRAAFRIEDSWLVEDGQTDETNAMADQIFALL